MLFFSVLSVSSCSIFPAFKLLNYHVIAAGDSFNDTAMLTEAHVGILFRTPDNVKAKFPQFKAVESYADLMKLVKEAMG